MTPHLLYLHGFASSPGSHKANLFRERLSAYDVNYHIPDLNVPSFERLTLTAMLERVAQTVEALPEGPVYLIGSSMGGLTALHFVDRHGAGVARRVERLMLLAPAFDFSANRRREMGDDWLAQWRAAGSLPYYHHAYGEERPVHVGLAEDILTYDSYATDVPLPTFIVHGQRDETVDPQQSVRYAEHRPHVTLHLVASDHQLLDQTDFIAGQIIAFFHLRPRE